MNWLLADAKNRLSKVVTLALERGPQRVQRRNQAVIILSETDYQRLTGVHPHFKDYLMQAPSFKDVDLVRDESSERNVIL